ncbi:MAG: site-2 protease family protein, partial [Candidatus Omnitrophica bacterium]|nr:site-2 protease family protein [Candidatus Omnitrophota bacterium]
VPAIVLHECAHGWVAAKLGDPTATRLGRLTLNPIKHVDPVGTIIVPAVLYLIHALGMTKGLFLFGWAKPVPVNFSRLNNSKRDMIFVALAGPVTNILIAVLLSQVIRSGFLPQISSALFWGVLLNLTLAVFNMIPIPPLDGGKVLMGLLPTSLGRHLLALDGPVGLVIVMIALNVGGLDFIDPVIYGFMHLIGLQ